MFTIARNAKKIFESSETHEKRAFLNFILQNPVVNGKKLEFTTKKPWNLVLELASTPTWLPTRVQNLDLSNVVRVFEMLIRWDRDAGRSV